MGELVQLEAACGIATIRLVRPPLNVLDARAQAELRAAAIEAEARGDVEAVVLWGSERVFSAGADIREMRSLPAARVAEFAQHLQLAFTQVASITKPVVAAVAGIALGGGCELAITADHRIGGENLRIGQPEILIGVIPGAGGTQRLPSLIGAGRATDLILTGRTLDAAGALAIGLVDRVVAPDRVYPEALAWARQFVGGPASALRAAKRAIGAGIAEGTRRGLDVEREEFVGLFSGRDQRIGMNHFLERGTGKPAFVGY
ncbi:MAG: enoyl-CoA hydratase/isomerase family protein [Micromonosporaceae bacterium]|nr:enoyl-CoA hydratase/isomerase family protein [Micromonosporaceae bacterium]